jgi:hypothetical protein
MRNDCSRRAIISVKSDALLHNPWLASKFAKHSPLTTVLVVNLRVLRICYPFPAAVECTRC